MDNESQIILLNFLSYGLIVLLFAIPLAILWFHRRISFKGGFVLYFIISMLIVVPVLFILAWCFDRANEMELVLLGYDYDGITTEERMKSVSEDNVAKVKILELSGTGLGWKVKAFFGIPMFLVYSVLIYIVNFFLRKVRPTPR